MLTPERCFAFIPARGGSKRLPRKNVLDLAGKPLVAHTIEAALKSGCFGTVMVSSDDDEILEIAGGYEGVVLDKRDPALAGDHARVVDVLVEVCEREEIHNSFDAFCAMLPTAPFRRLDDIRKGFDGLTADVDSVVAFMPYDTPPQMGITLSEPDNIMTPIFDPSPLITGDTRSQNHGTSYHTSGSFYFTWIESFRRLKSYFTGNVRGVATDYFGQIDIDRPEDLELARVIAEMGKAPSDII